MDNPLLTQAARAWLASIQNTPQEQVPARAIQAAQTGMLSFGDALAIKQMADRVRETSVAQPPQSGNVMTDLIQQINAGQMARQQGLAGLPAPAMDQAQFAGGIAGGMPQQPQMPTQMPTQMPNPQQPPVGMAGGGVVALQGGGWLQGIGQAAMAASQAAPVNPMARQISEVGIPTEDLVRFYEDALAKNDLPRAKTIEMALRKTPEGLELVKEIEQRKRQESMQQSSSKSREEMLRLLRGESAPVGAQPTGGTTSGAMEEGAEIPPPPERRVSPLMDEMALVSKAFGSEPQEAKTTKSYLEELEALQKERGIGQTSRDAATMLEEERAMLKEQATKDRHLLLSQAGFKMMAAASKGARFGEAAGVAGESFAAGMQNLNKTFRDSERELRRDKLRMKQADEALAAGNINAAMKLSEDAQIREEDAKTKRASAVLNLYTARLNRDVDMARLDTTERATLAGLAARAAETAEKTASNLVYDPKWPKLKPEEQVAARNKVFNETYNRIMGPYFQATGQAQPGPTLQDTSPVPQAVLDALSKYSR
jgi:hypothetical protein